jgi:hypothetical protein
MSVLVRRFRIVMYEVRSGHSVKWRLHLVIRLLPDGRKASSLPVVSKDVGKDGCSGRCIGWGDGSCFCG